MAQHRTDTICCSAPANTMSSYNRMDAKAKNKYQVLCESSHSEFIWILSSCWCCSSIWQIWEMKPEDLKEVSVSSHSGHMTMCSNFVRRKHQTFSSLLPPSFSLYIQFKEDILYLMLPSGGSLFFCRCSHLLSTWSGWCSFSLQIWNIHSWKHQGCAEDLPC